MRHLSDYTYHGLQHSGKKKENYEHIVFIVLLAISFIGIVSNIRYIGKVTSGSGFAMIDLGMHLNESSTFEIGADYAVTSIRAAGMFIGGGRGKLYVNDVLVVDSDDLASSGNLVTGFVVLESTNNTYVRQTVQETIENISQINLTHGNISGNVSDVQDNAIVDITQNIPQYVNNTIETTQDNVTALSQIINDSIDVILSAEDLVQQIEENISRNLTEILAATSKKAFVNYCKDSCTLSSSKHLVIRIELDNMILNLTTLVYGYDENSEDLENTTTVPKVNESLQLNQNLSETNVSINNDLLENLSILNSTLDILNNLTINQLANYTLNISANITYLNLTQNFTNDSFYETNLSLINLTIGLKNLTINGSDIITELFNLTVFNETVDSLTLGLDSKNYIRYLKGPGVFIGIKESDDTRIRSKFVILENISTAEIHLKASGNYVLRCIQYEGSCKRWVKTDLKLKVIDDSIVFQVFEPGVYSIAMLEPKEIQLIPSKSVYMNSNCDKCLEPNTCEAEGFCVVRDKLGFDFEAQLDFDILNIQRFDSAQVCGYIQYLNEPVINYLRSSRSNYCSGINNNESEDIITYKFINSTGWVCIDATDIVLDAYDRQYSNSFINWIGQDINGDPFPFSCYWAITNLSRCEGSNPSGANDCRPYLRLEYR